MRTARTRPRAVRAALRRHAALTTAVAVLLTVVVAAAGGELVARRLIRARVTASAKNLHDVSVGPGGGSALWNLTRRRIPRLDVTSDDADLGPLRQASVRARLYDVRLGGTPTVARSRVQVTASAGSLAAALRNAAPRASVTSVVPHPEDGTLHAAVGPGGLGDLTLRPELTKGRVTFSVDGLTLLGASVPTDRLGLEEGGLGEKSARRAYPLGLGATSVRVRSDGLHITLTGGASSLRRG